MPSFFHILFLLIVALSRQSLSEQTSPSDLLLPPMDFLAEFVEIHSLSGIELWSPVSPDVVPGLVRYRKELRLFSASFLNPLSDYSAREAPSDAKEERKNCSALCGVRVLHVVPPFQGAEERLGGVFGQWEEGGGVAQEGTRDPAEVDYWLIGTKAQGRQGEEEAKQLSNSLVLDLDDQVYFYIWDEDDGASSSDPVLRLFESYKVLPWMRATFLEYGEWNASAGLGVAEEDIWQRRSDMQGVTFRVSTLTSPPYITWMEEGRWEEGRPPLMRGMFADVFHAIQEVMNFTYELGRPPDGEWGANQGGGVWSGMVGQLQNGDIDIAATDFTVTQERSAVMTFAQPITQIYHSLFIKNPQGRPNYTAYTEPFHNMSWAVLFVIIVVAPPFLYAAVSFGPYYEAYRSEFTLGKSYVFASSVLTFARGWSVTPTRDRGRIAFASLLCGGTLIYYHWEAMLISYLATRVIVLPFESLEELVTNTDFKIALTPGSSYADAFRYSLDPLWQTAWSTRIEPDISTYPRSSALADLVLDQPQYALYDNYFAVETYPAYADCRIIAVPERHDTKPYAYGFQRDSPFLGPFNYYLKQLREKGATKKILDEYQVRPQVCPDYSGKPLGFDNCFTAFVVLIAGLVLGSILLFVEKSLITLGGLVNADLRFLESYGIDKRSFTLDEEQRIMQDPTFDETAKLIIHDKNDRIRELERMLEVTKKHRKKLMYPSWASR